ncbi:ABC transporter ATP-binding protein [Desulfonatronum lacustre]|uniref:ABC transporter ATP-binding protein n=1 Tax=Desulfonatronum lacustre TaxID=66849 RepID=UPI0004AF85E5|nr:ABC transporter ATP-binding protein [Desulfonatronum lacustre]SMP68747.1 NitT/TauT family transport system ATP-binding protein [Desulfonatronum zhilinae]
MTSQADHADPHGQTGRAGLFVEIKDVDLAYGEDAESLAVQGLNLDIREGDFVAVVGPSGCGKSTLLKLVTGLMPPTRGAVFVDGDRVGGTLSFVGMAFQNPTLLPWRDTLRNIMLPLEIVEPHRSRLRKEKPAYLERARNLLRTVGLAPYESKQPWELSGGMRQRANLCRALIHDPRLLMLDEPFGALDAFTREELWCVLADLRRAKQLTVVLVTHDLREAVFLADTVHVMSSRPGRIVHSRRVDLPGPRTLETCYEPAFVDIVHELRGHIERVRCDGPQGIADVPTA